MQTILHDCFFHGRNERMLLHWYFPSYFPRLVCFVEPKTKKNEFILKCFPCRCTEATEARVHAFILPNTKRWFVLLCYRFFIHTMDKQNRRFPRMLYMSTVVMCKCKHSNTLLLIHFSLSLVPTSTHTQFMTIITEVFSLSEHIRPCFRAYSNSIGHQKECTISEYQRHGKHTPLTKNRSMRFLSIGKI